MIAIVTDSTAYLTHEEAVELGVVVVPMSYSLGGGRSVNEGYIEEDVNANRQVAENIDGMHTSQATLSGFINAFQTLQKTGYEILCLPMSSRLSGTYANAMLAAKEVGGRIQVVDSLAVCAGLYMLIKEARRLIREGATLDEVAEAMNQMRHRLKVCFSVDDMTPLRRSGRLGNVRMSVSTVLNIKPILELREGVVVSTGLARGRTDQVNKLFQFCKDAGTDLIIDNFLGEEAAERLGTKLEQEGLHVLEQRRMGPVLGAHLGRGCVGVGYIEKI